MNDVRVFAVLYTGYVAAQMVASWRWQLAYYRVSREIERPPRLLSLWRVPALNEQGFQAAGVLLVAGCALGVAGWRPGLVLAVGAALAYFSQIMLLDTIQRKVSLIPQVLLLLAVSPATAAPWRAARDRWPLTIVTTLIVASFVSAGLTKLRRAGWRWADGRPLQAYLLAADLRYDIPRARRLAGRRSLCAMLSATVLLFELLGWVLLLVPAGTYVFAGVGLALHAGNLAYLRINYFKYFGPAYFVFAAHPVAGVIAAVAAAS